MVEVQILATNDFHGRLTNNTTNREAGAAVLSGAVKQLRATNPGNTFFAAAGDLIGASTFDSFIQQDKPTIDALNEAGLDVSAVGNHEPRPRVRRSRQPGDVAVRPDDQPAGRGRVGVHRRQPAQEVGRVARRGPDLAGDHRRRRAGRLRRCRHRGPAEPGLTGRHRGPPGHEHRQRGQRRRDQLTAAGADLVVLLVHEGAATTSLESATDPASAFGRIVNGVDADVDAIVSGHTHLAYNHVINGRPVVSAGQYGTALNQLKFSVDTTAGTATLVPGSNQVLFLENTDLQPNYPADAATTTIVQAAVDKAEVLGAQPLGRIAAAFGRARLSQVVGDTDENRGGESTLGNLVAEVHRWATSSATSGGAQIAFMNPGGLRADLTAATYPATLTYRQAANVQPFANTLVNMRLTGAQIKTVLEQQWQRDGSGNVPTRPFLRLGTSKGFLATYDPDPAARAIGSPGCGSTAAALVPTTSYSVTVNSFLASGGDNFRELPRAPSRRDTGKVDLAGDGRLPGGVRQPDRRPAAAPSTTPSTRSASRPAGAATFYRIGQRLDLRLSSLRMTAQGRPGRHRARAEGRPGCRSTRPKLDNAVGTDPFDEYGKVLVDSRLSVRVPTGNQVLVLTGPATGTVVRVPIQVRKAKPTLKAKVWPTRVRVDRTQARLKVRLVGRGHRQRPGQGARQGRRRGPTSGTLKDGRVKVTLREFGTRGKKKMEVKYLGTKAVKSVRTSVKVRVRR